MDPTKLYPIENFDNTVLLKPLVEASDVNNVSVGEYSYYSDFNDPSKFLENNVLYNFGFSGARLIIGKFCAFAHGVKFIMPDANHATQGVSTFPFAIFGGEWAQVLPLTEYPFKKYSDTVVGNDVWLGYDVTVMPGVHIGNGAIVGSKAVVSSDIPAYSIAAGNPAKVVKMRFSDEEREVLEQLAWWYWPLAHIEAAIPLLVTHGVSQLKAYARENGLFN